LSKAIIGDHIGDNEEYVRQLRALASTNALTALETALRPRTLEKFAEPSKRKITSLIVFIALTLDILLSVPTNGLLTPASSNNKAHCSMHEQLGLLLVHYLRHLCSKAFSPSSSLLSCFGNASGNVTLSGSFWSTLASERLPEPSVPDSGGEPQRKTDTGASYTLDWLMDHYAGLVVTSSAPPTYESRLLTEENIDMAHPGPAPQSQLERWLAEDQPTSPWNGCCSASNPALRGVNLDDVNAAL
jgi:hypothetical protein